MAAQGTVALGQTDANKLAGEQEAQNGDDAQTAEWIKMAPSGARATFEVPTRPRYVERSFTPVIGREEITVKLHISRSDDGLSSFVFSYHDMLERPTTAKAIDGALEGAMRGSLATVSGQLIESPIEIKYQGARGRQFIYRFEQNDKKYVVISRVYLLNERQYQLSVIMAGEVLEENRASTFLNSFRLVTPEPDLPPEPRFNR